MSEPDLRRGAADADATPTARVGVIDIGSHSIRLVIYERIARSPVVIFNEKVLCALGRGMDSTGRLNGDGVVQALENLRRFALIAQRMQVCRLDVLATAAVRDAEDGIDFVGRIEALPNLPPVQVLAGTEEARLSGYGVLSAIPDAEGLVGDLGGGSLELVILDSGGAVHPKATLPVGYLRLMEAGRRSNALTELVDGHLARQPWLSGHRGRPLYLVGGAWRAIAKLHLDQTGYPLHIIHRYTLAGDTARDFAGFVARQDKPTLDKLMRGSGRRNDTLPSAALVLERLLAVVAPSAVIFSAFGLREGHLFTLLSPDQRRSDPLLTGCADLMDRVGRFGRPGELQVWTESLFPGESATARRLRHAACLLSDLAWSEHPDYRAQHAFLRVLRLPLPGLDHVERVFLALAVHVRYAGGLRETVNEPGLGLLTEGQKIRALVLGLALRLGYCLTGGTIGLLKESALHLTKERLTLSVAERAAPLVGEVPRRRLAALAQALDRPEWEIKVTDRVAACWPHLVVD